MLNIVLSNMSLGFCSSLKPRALPPLDTGVRGRRREHLWSWVLWWAPVTLRWEGPGLTVLCHVGQNPRKIPNYHLPSPEFAQDCFSTRVLCFLAQGMGTRPRHMDLQADLECRTRRR